MSWNNLLQSGFAFAEDETLMAFRYRILNTIMLVAMVFALLFAVLSSSGVNDIGRVHTSVDYLYGALSALLIILLRRRRDYFRPVSIIFLAASFLTFVSALHFVQQDEFRIVWFYFVNYASYVLLGSRAGAVATAASLLAIGVSAALVELQLSETALVTAIIGLLVGSLLTRTYTVQMGRYEALVEGKNRALESNIFELDNALHESHEASRAKTLFLANMSHEIRTPMNGVLGMVQVMRETQLDEQQLHYLDTIDRSGKILLFLINDLLDLSKIESGTLQLNPLPFEPFQWVLDIQVLCEPLFEESVVSFVSEVDDQLPGRLQGDAARLLQVVVNLVGNAAKFTHQGEVRLTVGGHYVGDDRYCLQLAVADTGIGIPDERLNDIFEAFQQVSPERISSRGVGLGLAISRQIVSAMGGSLQVTSQLGRGSTFRVEVALPLLDEKDGGETLAPAGQQLPDGLAVLVVDDDPINRLAASTLLRQRGYSVAEAEDGHAALRAIEAGRFNVVLMDVHMPGMDGIEATRAIRANPATRELPVIGLTASVMSDEREQYMAAGMNAVVEKPVVVEKLMACIAGLAAHGGRS